MSKIVIFIYNNNERLFSIPQGQIRESTGLLDSHSSRIDQNLYKHLL